MQIISYHNHHRDDFRRLNQAWIEKYFVMEVEDEKVLNDPEKEILDKGGKIILASVDDEVAGTCALIYSGERKYQLAKMAVDDKFKGKGVGNLLMKEVIDQYRKRDGQLLFLYTNSVLTPAITLYRKFGFVEKPLTNAFHKRSNMYMEFEEKNY